MRVVIVCSGNVPHGAYDFETHQNCISDQIRFIRQLRPDVEFYVFSIVGRGIPGYLRNLNLLRNYVKGKKIGLIHAHYSLSGLLANLQKSIAVVTTFHGSDINDFRIRPISNIVSVLSDYSIFVSDGLYKRLFMRPGKNYSIIPCGVNREIFGPLKKEIAREAMNLKVPKKYVLFASSFDKKIKNYPLAEKAVNILKNAELIELKGFKRDEVNLLLNAVDCLLLTSFAEGSPQIIKEAMACGCPIVSTDVGDVKKIIGSTEGCYISSFDPRDIAQNLILALDFDKKTTGMEKIKHLDNRIIAEKILSVYECLGLNRR